MSHLRAILNDIDRSISSEDKEFIKGLSEGGLSALHFSLGLFIRNRYIHPGSQLGDFWKNEIGDPDMISGFLSKCYWRDLKGMSLNQNDIGKVLTDNLIVWEENHARELAGKMLEQEKFNTSLHTDPQAGR